MLLTFWTSFCDTITLSDSLLVRRWITHISVSICFLWFTTVSNNMLLYFYRPSSERTAVQLGYAKLHGAATNEQWTFERTSTSQQRSRRWYRSTNCHLTRFLSIATTNTHYPTATSNKNLKWSWQCVSNERSSTTTTSYSTSSTVNRYSVLLHLIDSFC